MATIRILPDDVVRRIAAGEVVERPASVVKELLENAIDANARHITVTTAGAGEGLIEVVDDGVGMSREDVELAPMNASTSKIQTSDDLHNVATYGFRGEALASISSVCRFELISSDRTEGEGWRVEIEGKSVTLSEPAARERGTTVRVRDLFFNTPARKRFLKTAATERRRILETILSFALILPDVELHYIDDGRHILDLLPATSWRDRVASVLGATTMKHIVEVDAGTGNMKLTGFASLPTHTRGNRNQQFFFVNGRAVRERTLVQSLQDAYRNVIPYKRFPVAVLALELPAGEVDVNVHPSKMEVRVENERQLFGLVRGGVKAALSARAERSLPVNMASGVTAGAATRTYAEPPAKGLFDAPPPPTSGAQKVISLHERIHDTFGDFGVRRDEPSASTREAVESLRGQGLGDEGLFWQFHNTFIFVQVRGGIVVIDQHAAHERIIFDTSKQQLEQTAPPSQQILFSVHLELSLSELEVFRSSREVFTRLGFDVEGFGGKSILVRGYPQWIRNWGDGKLLLEIFDDILQDNAPGDSMTDKLIASFACRSAIKAGQKLSVVEMRDLADRLFAIDNPYSCPHGRPTIHRISLEEIERWFHRR